MGFLKKLENMISSFNEVVAKQDAIYEQENSIIASAVQNGNSIYIYSARGNMIGVIPGYELVGFTSTTVTARSPNDIHTHYIFDAKGNLKSSFGI